MVKETLIYCQPILSLKPRKKDARRMEMMLMSRNQPVLTCTMTTWGESIALTSFIFLHHFSTLQKVVQVFVLVYFLALYC